MAPPEDRPSEAPSPRPDVEIVEAGDPRARTCGDCGRRSAAWKPVRRQGTSVILCAECAAKPAPGLADGCPACGATLRTGDRFCGTCGIRIEYACPACGTVLDAEDMYCGRCGTRVS